MKLYINLTKLSNIIFASFLFVVSIVLYIFSPEVYSHSFSVLILILFLISYLMTVQQTIINNNYFNFHVLFLFSFLFVNFVYPVFIYPSDPEHFPVFKLTFNHDIISKATALALCGVTAYSLGVSLSVARDYQGKRHKETNFRTIQILLTYWLYIIFLIIIFFAGKEMMSGVFGAAAAIPPGLLVIFQVSIGLSVILLIYTKTYQISFFDFFWRFNKPLLFILVIFVITFIYIGDRGPVIQISLILIAVLSSFIKPIKLRLLIPIIVVGMVVFTFISYARTSNVDSLDSKFIKRGLEKIRIEAFYDVGMDLIINNRNLYAGYEYANENGFLYGKNIYHYIFAPIPYLPSFFTELLYDASPKELTTARIITDESGASYGLGTNIIADLYMSFGFIGVITIMVLFGYSTSRFQILASSKKNISSVIIYIFLVGFSIYLPRTTIFNPVRHIIWALFLFYALRSIRLGLIRISRKQNMQINDYNK